MTLAALGAAVMIALQPGMTYWFYLYLVWFFPLALVALLGRFGARRGVAEAAAAPAHEERTPVPA